MFGEAEMAEPWDGVGKAEMAELSESTERSSNPVTPNRYASH
jgi:hypothetical protein